MTSTAGGQWTADNPTQPGTYPSRAADPRAVINELDVVHGSLDWWEHVGDEDMDSHLGSHGYGSSIMRAIDGEDWRVHLRTASLPDFDPEFGFHMRASWADVLAKAKRIRAEGGVRILVATASLVAGEVQGDHHLYESTINYVPGRRSLADWTCGCKWGAYAWGRSPAYRRFEGRRCSHVTALQYEAQSRGMFGREVSTDEERLEGQYQRSPVTVQYQRPTERAPGGNINRRTVPPANMRSEWTERSRVQVKGELASRWEGSIGPGPGQYGLPPCTPTTSSLVPGTACAGQVSMIRCMFKPHPAYLFRDAQAHCVTSTRATTSTRPTCTRTTSRAGCGCTTAALCWAICTTRCIRTTIRPRSCRAARSMPRPNLRKARSTARATCTWRWSSICVAAISRPGSGCITTRRQMRPSISA